MNEFAGFEQLGRRHWRWRGEVPGAPDAVLQAVEDALNLMRPAKLTMASGTIVARVGGIVSASWAATEEITVRVAPAAAGGTSIEIASRSVQLSLTDSGRNRAAIVTLLGSLGINEA